MTSRTAVRRSAVAGLGLVGAVALTGTAQAQTVPSPGGVVPGAVQGIVDPLTTPLSGTIAGAVRQAQPLVDQAPAPVPGVVQQVTTPLTGPAPTGPQPPVAPPATTAPGGTQNKPPQSPAQPPAAQQPPTQAPAVAPAPGPAPTGGFGVASMPDSLARKINTLEQFSPGSGFASAANPMSLFGAPEVAPTLPAVTAEVLPTPLAIRPAGAGLEGALPVRAVQDLPAVLVAVAFTAVAAAGAAQVAVRRGRRQGAAPA